VKLLPQVEKEKLSMKGLNTREVVSHWLMQLKPGDPGFVLDEYGQCRLISEVEKDHCIVFVPAADKPSYHLFQDVWQLPGAVDAACYENLLALNLLGTATAGGFLGFDAETRSLVFSLTGSAVDSDAKSFYVLLERFFDTAQGLRARLASLFGQDSRNHCRESASARNVFRKYEIQRSNER
jgi:hypothetical protein